jgi:hypothetical protein
MKKGSLIFVLLFSIVFLNLSCDEKTNSSPTYQTENNNTKINELFFIKISPINL